MVEIIKSIINKWCCMHEWDEIKKIRVDTDFGGYYHKFLFVCKKCGKFKLIKT